MHHEKYQHKVNHVTIKIKLKIMQNTEKYNKNKIKYKKNHDK